MQTKLFSPCLALFDVYYGRKVCGLNRAIQNHIYSDERKPFTVKTTCLAKNRDKPDIVFFLKGAIICQ